MLYRSENNLPRLQFLLEKTGLINEIWVQNSLSSLAIKWNDALFNSLYHAILVQTNGGLINDLPFELPVDQDQILGELELGQIIDCGIRLRVPIKALPMHICIAGFSGSGKSTLAMRIVEEAIENGIDSIWIIDPKADEYVRLALKYPDFLILKWHDLRFSPLEPASNVPQNELFQTFVGHLAQNFNFWQGAESFLLNNINYLAQNNKYVNLVHLLNLMKSNKRIFSQKDALVKSTVISRIEMLLQMFGPTITTDSRMLEYLREKKVIISTSGLMSESDSWLTEFLILWEYLYRVYNPNSRFLTIRIFDECQHRLFNIEKERNINRISSSIISQLVDQSRAMNICICSLSQEPSTLIKAVLNNSWLKVAFHVGSGNEIKVISEGMGLDKEQSEYLHYLETGEALVRMAGGYMHPLPVKFDNYIDNLVISESEFLKNQKELKEQLYKETVLTQKYISSNNIPSEDKTTKSANQEVLNRQLSLKPTKKITNSEDNSNDKVISLLQVWLNQKYPFLTQGQIFDKAGIKSGSAQAKYKKDLIRKKMIKDHKIQVAKTYASIWEPLELAYELVSLKKPKYHSKGGYVHQFIAHHIKNWSANHGYDVDIEFMLSNKKSVDAVLRNNDVILFIEIAISPPLSKEINNIIKDLETDLVPDKLILVVQDNKTKRQIEEQIQRDIQENEYLELISIELAGKYLIY